MEQNPKTIKDMLLKDLSPQKLKQLSVIFISDHIKSSLTMLKLYMIYDLIIDKNLEGLFQLLVTCVIFLFTALLTVI